jgi:cysteine desulfurase family protein
VYAAVDRYQRELGAPAGRSSYREASEVERLVRDARRQVAVLLGVADPRRIIFTSNGTDSLNLALHGLLRTGDHVVTTVVEHNSVLRPLRQLETVRGVEVTRVSCSAQGIVDVDDLRHAIQPHTRLIALCHVSNVTGAIQPAQEAAQLARQHGALLLLDAAQSLGHLPISVDALGVDLLAAPGHKGLLGPLGTGVLYVRPGLEQHLEPQRQGGTGTQSEQDIQPATLPDRYESGNHCVPGLVGLGAGVAYLQQRGIDDIRRHEQQLLQRLIDGVRRLSGVTVHGPADPRRQSGVVSLTVAGYDPQEVAALLDSAYSVQVRSGLHCAPRMHAALGTAAGGGTVRFSVGPFNSGEHIDRVIGALEEIASANPSS